MTRSIRQYDCFAVTSPGLEALATRELTGLGLAPGAVEPGGVAFTAGVDQLYTANLHLRTVSRVLVRLADFRATAFWELEKQAARVPWSRVVPVGGAVAFRVTSRKSKLYHGRGIAERLAASVAQAVRGARPGAQDSEPGDPAVQEFVVRVFRDQVTVSADSSGALLHRRGYRQATAKAPLRETLAAAMLLGSGWEPTEALLDPCCGSGTIAIEAALMARRIPPGWRRAFACERWPEFDPAARIRIRDAAEARMLPRAPAPILGSDRDAGAIEAARANASRAAVDADIRFERVALSRVSPPPGPGWVVTNPPYGVRVGEADRLRDLYAALGRFCRERVPGWGVALLVANPRLSGQTGLDLAPAWRARNGGIPVRLEVGHGVSG